jgi:hypothetical protein
MGRGGAINVVMKPPLRPYRARGAPASAPAFSPTSITGLQCWLDDTVSTHWGNAAMTQQSDGSDGNAIGGWQDRSGVGNHATQTISGSRAIWKTNIQNSRGMMLFDGTADYLRVDGLAQHVDGEDPALTLLAVIKKVGNASLDAIFSAGASGSATPFHSTETNGVTSYQVRRRDDAASVNTAATTGAAPDTTAHVVVYRCNGTTLDVWIDGVQRASAVALNVGTLTINQAALACLIRTGADTFLEGYIGEFLFYNVALLDADRATLEAWLKARWGTA